MGRAASSFFSHASDRRGFGIAVARPFPSAKESQSAAFGSVFLAPLV